MVPILKVYHPGFMVFRLRGRAARGHDSVRLEDFRSEDMRALVVFLHQLYKNSSKKLVASECVV